MLQRTDFGGNWLKNVCFYYSGTELFLLHDNDNYPGTCKTCNTDTGKSHMLKRWLSMKRSDEHEKVCLQSAVSKRLYFGVWAGLCVSSLKCFPKSLKSFLFCFIFFFFFVLNCVSFASVGLILNLSHEDHFYLALLGSRFKCKFVKHSFLCTLK